MVLRLDAKCIYIIRQTITTYCYVIGQLIQRNGCEVIGTFNWCIPVHYEIVVMSRQKYLDCLITATYEHDSIHGPGLKVQLWDIKIGPDLKIHVLWVIVVGNDRFKSLEAFHNFCHLDTTLEVWMTMTISY